MAVYFSGTATGNKYEVGREYLNSRGQVVVANQDGSFGNNRDNSWSPGSVDNPNVQWYASGSDAARMSAPARYSAGADAMSGGSATLPARGAAPAGAVAVPSPNAAAATAFNRGAFKPSAASSVWARVDGMNGKDHPYLDMRRDNYAWSGEANPPQDLKMFGMHVRLPPHWSNGEDIEMAFGDNELVSTLYGTALVGATIGYNARVAANEHGWDDGRGAYRAIVAGTKPDVLAEAFAGAVKGIREQAAENNRIERELIDAYDLRDELTRREALKAGDWTAIPGVAEQQKAFQYGPGWGTWAWHEGKGGGW